jgi:hypothetical protein
MGDRGQGQGGQRGQVGPQAERAGQEADGGRPDAIRIRCVSSSWSSLPYSRRHQHLNPPGLCPAGKNAFSTARSTQS